MGLETGTWITDFVATNPGSSDLESQGDDHIRLVKSILQNTFPTASKAWYNPTSQSKSADFTVVAADMNKTFLVTTTGGLVNMTLPTLASGDAGWECFVMKITADVNPIMVKPPTGTLSSGPISGLAAARRCIPTNKISCYWTGTTFVIGRAANAGGPVGSCLEYHGATLPFGFEWPNGQTLASASTNYPEFNAVMGSGVTFDKRGRIGYPLDNLGGSAASRITTAGGGIDGATLGAVGGGQNVNLITSNLPAYTPSGSVATSTSGTIAGSSGGAGSINNQFAYGSGSSSSLSYTSNSVSTFTGSAQGGAASAIKTLGPGIMVAQLMVTE
jgi:hypothetical protein